MYRGGQTRRRGQRAGVCRFYSRLFYSATPFDKGLTFKWVKPMFTRGWGIIITAY